MTRRKSPEAVARFGSRPSQYQTPLDKPSPAPTSAATVEFTCNISAFGSKQHRRVRVCGDVVDLYDASSCRWWLGYRLSRSAHAAVIAARDRLLESST